MRNEIKFPINNNLDLNFQSWKDFKKQVRRLHDDRVVNSIYYDTENFSAANNNLMGISNRSKYRIRWYNHEKSNFFYEIKIKKNNLGKKIILKSKEGLKNTDNYFSHKNVFLKEKENEFFLNHINEFNLKPVLKISYLRSYFIFNKKVRMTYDRNIKYTFLNRYSIKDNEIKDFMNVLELKFNQENYGIAADLVKDMNFIPKRFSKYLRGLYLTGKAIYF